MEIIAQSHIKRVVVHARGALVTRAVAELDSGGDDVDLILKGITPLVTSSMRMRPTPATTLSTVPTGGVTRPMELLMMNSTPK